MWYAAAAAALLLGISIPAAYHYSKPKTEQTEPVVQYVETVTRRGEIKTVILPDNTAVTLNAGSILKYPDRFTTDERPVELYGEALFDVTPDQKHPFNVKTESMNIKVLGTVFDVKAYENDTWATVSVVSGKVEVGLSDKKVLLEKNQRGKMNNTSRNFEKLTIDANESLSWTNGTLYFDQTPIMEVVNILNRYYPQVEIELAEGEFTNMISGKFDNQQMQTVLKSITYSTGLRYKKTGGKYIIYK
jgi:ferric-dicitrate binding protein FerR (iron transport regulator)